MDGYAAVVKKSAISVEVANDSNKSAAPDKWGCSPSAAIAFIAACNLFANNGALIRRPSANSVG